MSFSGLTIKTFIVLKRRYALSLRLRSLLSMGARFVFQLRAIFLKGITAIFVEVPKSSAISDAFAILNCLLHHYYTIGTENYYTI